MESSVTQIPETDKILEIRRGKLAKSIIILSIISKSYHTISKRIPQEIKYIPSRASFDAIKKIRSRVL